MDLYANGRFTLYTLFLQLVNLRCVTQSEGYISPAQVIKVKTGAQRPDPKFPDVPQSWWNDEGTVVIVKVPQVSASIVGKYRCYAKHEYVNEKAAVEMNATITVNGCPPGLWGMNCLQQCNCQNGGTCHSWDGSCLCEKSWKGITCETENPHLEIVVDDVYIGDPLTLQCMAYALQVNENNYTWFFDQDQVASGDSALNILKVNESHEANFTCRVITDDGLVFTQSTLLSTKGCRPGMYGMHCDLVCNCGSDSICARYEGCMCQGQRCDIAPNVNLTTEGNTTMDGAANGTTVDTGPGEQNRVGMVVGCAVGGVVFVLILVVGLIVVLRWKELCKNRSVVSQSKTHLDYLKTKDVSELVKTMSPLETSDPHELMSHWRLVESCLYIGKQIAEGCFSTVYEGHVLKDGNLYRVAIKVLKDEKDEVVWDNFMGEFQILAHVCKHPNIVQMIGLCTKSILSKVVSCLVLEYMAGGSLRAILLANRRPKTALYVLQPHHFSQIVQDVITGMAYLEKMRYVHRDLAARNVLLSDTLVAKISDFGLARDTYTTGEYRRSEGPRKALPWKWMAYESIKDNEYTSKSDVWSFGVLLWEIATLGASPYPGVSNEGLLAHLDKGLRPEKPSSCSKVWYAAMKICWEEAADDRPTFGELKGFYKDLFKKKKNHSPFIGDAAKSRGRNSLHDGWNENLEELPLEPMERPISRDSVELPDVCTGPLSSA